jgi:hypothetical protein
MRLHRLGSLLLCIAGAAPVGGQGIPPELAGLRQRVSAMRAAMDQVTAVADYAADLFTRDTTARFLISGTRQPGLRGEFDWHTGSSPDFRDADNPAAHGIVLMPVAAWESNALSVAVQVERWKAAGRSIILLASTAGSPGFGAGMRTVPNGASDGTAANAPINEIANVIAAWTLYLEFVASATRHGWQPGIYVSQLVANADNVNSAMHFHAPPGRAAVVPIPPGRLGALYLDRIDSLLNAYARPAHQATMQRAADSLRAVRSAGHRLFVSACAHYLQGSLLRDSLLTPFRPVYAHWDVAPQVVARGGRAGDALLWFGYDGYDCPHVAAAAPLQQSGFKVVAAAGNLPAAMPANVLVTIPLLARTPEHIANVPFNPEGVGSATSVDAMLHYLWLKRLVGMP